MPPPRPARRPTEALGFYLDQRRIHVGDLTALTEEVFTAWQADRSRGVDAIMLAPTRELVSQLNQRARSHRLTTQTNPIEARALRVVLLADGNPASVGDQVITEPTTGPCGSRPPIG